MEVVVNIAGLIVLENHLLSFKDKGKTFDIKDGRKIK